jgi:potassium/chloride transporter 4/5/6
MLSFDASPSFRPTWRYFHWSTSLAGMCICLGMMFFIYWQFALAALVFSMLLYKFMERQLNQRMHDEEEGNDAGAAARADWTSGRRYNNCRESLLKLKERDMEFKYWRPFVLFLCKLDKEEGTYVPQSGMINLISQLMKRGKGMSFIAGVVKGEYNRSTAAMARKAQKHLAALIAEKGIEGFPEVVVAPTIGEGQRYMVQGKGFGVLRPNTVMMGFPSNLQVRRAFAWPVESTWNSAQGGGKS